MCVVWGVTMPTPPCLLEVVASRGEKRSLGGGAPGFMKEWRVEARWFWRWAGVACSLRQRAWHCRVAMNLAWVVALVTLANSRGKSSPIVAGVRGWAMSWGDCGGRVVVLGVVAWVLARVGGC